MNNILIEDFSKILENKYLWKKLKNSSILITGVSGYLANYLIKFFLYLNKEENLNIKIIGTTRNVKETEKKFGNLIKNKKLFFFQTNLLNSINIKHKIDYVIHMASPASPKYFESNPVNVIEPNITGTINLLNFSFKKKIKKFLFISTSGVYGFVDDKKRPNDESTFGFLDNTLPESIYLESKRMAETICIAYKNQYKVPVSIIRPSISYGPGISLDDGRSFADFINNIIKNQDIKLFSKGNVMRNFCYISDVISGILLILIKGKNGESYNLASEKEISIKMLANFLVQDVFPEKKLKVIYSNIKKKLLRPEFKRTLVCCNKVKKLGWIERISLKDGFKRTAKWYET
ncbi:NAD-dependent epimerase/dehydratase family protein [Rickettsiales bacterium]|nr:NAD-dependent epimerase/dehydratase family protein [Rickettsiales bacterium]